MWDTRAIAHLATLETNARQVRVIYVTYFECYLCTCVVYQMSTNVPLRFVLTEERASMEWTSTLAFAHLAIQGTTARRVSAIFLIFK